MIRGNQLLTVSVDTLTLDRVMTENVNRTAFDVCQIDYVLHEVVALERASERRRISVVGNIQMDNDITENNNR